MNTDEQGWNNSGSNNDGGGRSPRERSGDAPRRSRSRSPGANRDRDDRGGRRGGDRGGGEGGAGVNPGNNLHVSGLSHKVDTRELEAAFSKIGRVQKASVMYDPHTRESRGFGFVTMETAEEADAAITALNTTELMGKVMNVEKARRGRARTPTPGRYYGPPKRGDSERPYDPRPYDSRYSRDYDDRRGGRGRYDDHRGGRDHDRHRDYDRGDRDRDYDGGRRGGYDDRRDRGGRYDSGRY
ncbi:hypothetical protein BDQ12DRAFT_357096 [Crucibulum laeve]|uniref:RRM domain-containing protein n=1 Tax=Crucibulum laeve TaxID=68775 RepID=A0A5C3MBE0_9AGAR|nr:hypothetical protein BDQ12DRAFT_357096 [Crucibulum laeve]